MNWDIFLGNWKKFKGKAKVRWGRFKNDRSGVINGKRIHSAGMIQQAHGTARDKMRHKEGKSL